MKRIIYVCFFALLFSSCTTSESQDPFESESNFYALTVGNTWVYKNYKYNSATESYDDTGVIDSVSITNTEIINDNTYFRFKINTSGNDEGITFCNPNGVSFELLRDSIGYLIRDDGRIEYANTNFQPRAVTVADWGTVYDQLIADDHEITIESGTFMSTYTQRYTIATDGEQLPGIDHMYYADGVGLIYDSTSFVTQDIPSIIKRLDAYTVE